MAATGNQTSPSSDSREVRGPLAHLRVLDAASGVAGSFCGKMFADNGADVVKLEDPDRPGLRVLDERWLDSPGALFIWLNANKRGAIVPTDEARFFRLVASTDVLIEDGTLAGIDPAFRERLRATNPSLVLLTVTPFGVTGPFADRPASTLTLNALAGVSGLNAWEGWPYPEPGKHLEVQAGIAAYIAAVAAIYARRERKLGQWVEVAELDVAASVLNPNFTRYFMDGHTGGMGPSTLWRCKDGYVYVLASPDRAWEMIKLFLGLHHLNDDPRFSDITARIQNSDAVRGAIEPALADLTRKQIFEGLSELRAVCGMILEPGEVLDDPHLAARDYFVPTVGSRYGVDRFPRPAPLSSAFQWRLQREAPGIGEHHPDVMAEWCGD